VKLILNASLDFLKLILNRLKFTQIYPSYHQLIDLLLLLDHSLGPLMELQNCQLSHSLTKLHLIALNLSSDQLLISVKNLNQI
jgi:hypothetical protein